MAGVIGLAKALEYVQNVGLDKIEAYEHELLAYGIEALSSIEELKFIGTPAKRAGAISFVVDGIHPHDIGTWVDREEGVAIRAGHHCTQPVMTRYNIPSTTRASIALYNKTDDFDALVRGLKSIIKVFGNG